MARTGFWFQMARGRALVRTKAMKEARKAQAILARNSVAVGFFAADLTEGQRAYYQREIAWQVKRAREANRDHRKYRKLHLETELED